MKAPPWTDSEIDAGITLYLTMICLAGNRIKYNKAAMIREERGRGITGGREYITSAAARGPRPALFDRSQSSVEMKLMNICSAVEQLGRKDLSMAEHGFRPAKNMQKKLMPAVAARIKGVYVAISVNSYVEERDDPAQQQYL